MFALFAQNYMSRYLEFYGIFRCQFWPFKEIDQNHFKQVSLYVFSRINVSQFPREMLKTETEGCGSQRLPRELVHAKVLENNI